jgi:hypothetical protein
MVKYDVKKSKGVNILGRREYYTYTQIYSESRTNLLRACSLSSNSIQPE